MNPFRCPHWNELFNFKTNYVIVAPILATILTVIRWDFGAYLLIRFSILGHIQSGDQEESLRAFALKLNTLPNIKLIHQTVFIEEDNVQEVTEL
jgi:hypothetical protein